MAVRHSIQSVAKRRTSGARTLNVTIRVMRERFAPYVGFSANACVAAPKRPHRAEREHNTRRCQIGRGASPTAAVASALAGLARVLK